MASSPFLLQRESRNQARILVLVQRNKILERNTIRDNQLGCTLYFLIRKTFDKQHLFNFLVSFESRASQFPIITPIAPEPLPFKRTAVPSWTKFSGEFQKGLLVSPSVRPKPFGGVPRENGFGGSRIPGRLEHLSLWGVLLGHLATLNSKVGIRISRFDKIASRLSRTLAWWNNLAHST